MFAQSRSQSLQAFLSAVGRLKTLWENGIEVRQEFLAQKNRPLHETANQNKKRYFIRVPQSRSGDQPLTKMPDDSVIEIGVRKREKSFFSIVSAIGAFLDSL